MDAAYRKGKPSAIIILLALLALAALSFPFSIDSYKTKATVMGNGDLQIAETMDFTLEKEYNEGFRSIRKEDFGSLGDISVQSVKVNGAGVPYTTQMNGDQAEIVWKKTYPGANKVELRYTIKDRAQLFNDFAKICYEHYGANWPASASVFESRMELPEAARGKDMHFEVYSSKKGDAFIDDLTVVIQMNGVPAGNYIGGCYLYDKSALKTGNLVNASALQILQDERKAYGSEEMIGPSGSPGSITCCCLPLAILAAALAIFYYVEGAKVKRLPENILPPDKEEPAVVTVLVRNRISDKSILASCIIDLINRGILDIVELEKKGETSAEINRERTILFLKKRPADLKPYENAVLDMIFSDGKKEVDLDRMAADYDKIKTKAESEDSPVAKNMGIFTSEIERILKGKEIWDLRNSGEAKTASLAGFGFFGLIVACGVAFVSVDFISAYIANGDWLEIIGTAASFAILLPALIYDVFIFTQRPSVPQKLRDEYSRWDAFARAVKSSRLKEYPPGSAVIWGDILVYATALDLADKVKHHLSELDLLTSKRLEKLDAVRKSSYHYYASALAIYNLKTYGRRSGPSTSHGGFSSHSSGGWSSGGGGGFSGGSSGGGGFR